ncbi:response regulator [Chloroflexota bacterium]
MQKIRVLIVDDHTLVRDGIKALLSLVSDVEVIGEAENGREAIERVRELAPNVVLMDLSMPLMGGLDATRRIRKEFPKTRVIAVTQYDDSEYVIPIIEAGACGFVTKMMAFSDLAAAIQAAHRGESFLSPTAAASLVEEFQQKMGSEGGDSYQHLTDREREVLKLTAEGHTIREIADMLVVSPKTVEWYKTNLMNKLNIHSKTDLIKYAIRKRVINI